jgi:hypothetical protein
MVLLIGCDFYYLWRMFIREVKKKNGPGGKTFSQFSLAQNSRVNGKVKQRNLLYLGSDQILTDSKVRRDVVDILKAKIFGQEGLFPSDVSEDIIALALSYYGKYVELYGDSPVSDAVSIPAAPDRADYHQVDISKLAFKDVRTFGGENLCEQVIHKLELDKCLFGAGWQSDQVNKALIAICARALFSASEHKTAQYLADNSELASLFGDEYSLNHKQLYTLSDQLYDQRERIDKHIYNKVCDWFKLEDKLVIFDISNTFFEGSKSNSKLAQFGRSKEKRSDCRLVVFTGVINAEGFIRHWRIYEGNKADSATLDDMIEDLENHSTDTEKKTVVMDAGIATEENLATLRDKNYKYVCVSRIPLKTYEAIDPDKLHQEQLSGKNKTNIQLSILTQDQYPDTWMYVKSPGKARKEESMNQKLSDRYLQDLQSLKDGLQKKGTVKKTSKVYEKLGRLKEQHSRVSHLYPVEVSEKEGIVTGISWQLDMSKEKKQKLEGVYFIRTNHEHSDESQLWKIYNTIREVESTFRCLKSDLNIRPVHHQLDSRVQSHIYLTILAYQLVNTIRHLLKKSDIHFDWKNIVRLMQTQITQTVIIPTDKKTIHLRKPSEPSKAVEAIYNACQCKHTIKPKRKYVVYH